MSEDGGDDDDDDVDEDELVLCFCVLLCRALLCNLIILSQQGQLMYLLAYSL